MNDALTMWELGDVLTDVALDQDLFEEDFFEESHSCEWEIPIWPDDPSVRAAWALFLFLVCATIALYWIKG